jgi:basic membrane protein A
MRVFLITFASGCVGPWPVATPVGPEPLLDEVRAAFVYPGPIGDHGWSFAHNEGREQLANALGVTTTFREIVAPADFAAEVEGFDSEGYNLVIAASADYISASQQAADDYPESYFMVCGGRVSQQNLTSYFGRMYQPIYLAGYLAASMTETGRIGVVSAKPLPEFVRHIDAFTLGARSADPSVVVDIRWIDSFFDPPLETQFANDLMDAGADVILTQTDSTIPVEQVELRADAGARVFSIAYDNEDACEGFDACLTSAYWNWGPTYKDAVNGLLDGTWNPDDITWRPFTNDSDSTVGLSDIAPIVPAAVRTAVSEARNALLEDDSAPFVGPLTDSTGTLRLAEGERMSDEVMDRICWYVDGVITSESGTDAPATVPNGCQGDR